MENSNTERRATRAETSVFAPADPEHVSVAGAAPVEDGGITPNTEIVHPLMDQREQTRSNCGLK